MRKFIIVALLLSLSSAGAVNVYADDAPGNDGPPPQKKITNTHKLGEVAPAASGSSGIIAAAVSVLGLIALAASSSSGDATPAATTHTR